MLNRMVTLSEESANGTYQDSVDRENLQAEMDALKDEINRIADSANFNGISLLDGSMAKTTVVTAATAVTVTPVKAGAHGGAAATGTFTIDLSQLEITNKSTTAASGVTITIGGQTVSTKASTTSAMGTISVATGATIKGSKVASALNGKYVKIDGANYKISANGSTITLTGTKAPTATANTAMTFTIANGTNTDDNQGHALSVDVVKQPVSASANKYAQGQFTLTASMVKDGNVITIGTTAYTIKVGSKSTVTGDNLIDLSAYDGTNNTDKMLQEAAQKIASKDNSKFLVSTNNTLGANPVISLTEKDGAVDYAKDWDLSNHTGYNTGDWTGVVSYGAIDNTSSNGGLTLQIGDTSDSWNQMNVSINDMHVSSLKIATISIKTQSAAASAISIIKDAINYVSSTRGTLGATQNRLEHTANNLSVMTENIQDAESTIRDTDIADEMTAYTKNQILVQSAQAMLAQANSVPQGVLQLLQ
jgi:flagellin